MGDIREGGAVILRVPGDVGAPPERAADLPVCPCDVTELRAQMVKSYRVAVFQCLKCGRSVRHVKRSKAERASLPPFDVELRERGYAARAAAGAELRASRQAAWWAWYDAYLLSPKWRAIREQVLKRDKWTCRVMRCGRPATQVHHLTYERVGDEWPDDLVAICAECHDHCHDR